MTEKDLIKFIQNALIEDVGDGDHTSLASIPSNATSQAHPKQTIWGIYKLWNFPNFGPVFVLNY